MSRNQQKNALVSETVKANQLWGEVLDNAAFEAEQMGKSLTVNFPPGPWPLYGNPNALESALENIVRNALRYSHTKIEVGFAVDIDGITITVDDDGPGVSPEDREQIFRPFYRTDEARDRESGGTGLGLAIVETAIQQHRGWVKAEDSPLGGLRLVIWLPLYKRYVSLCVAGWRRNASSGLHGRGTFPHKRRELSSILPLKRRFCIVLVQLFDSPAADSKR